MSEAAQEQTGFLGKISSTYGNLKAWWRPSSQAQPLLEPLAPAQETHLCGLMSDESYRKLWNIINHVSALTYGITNPLTYYVSALAIIQQAFNHLKKRPLDNPDVTHEEWFTNDLPYILGGLVLSFISSNTESYWRLAKELNEYWEYLKTASPQVSNKCKRGLKLLETFCSSLLKGTVNSGALFALMKDWNEDAAFDIAIATLLFNWNASYMFFTRGKIEERVRQEQQSDQMADVENPPQDAKSSSRSDEPLPGSEKPKRKVNGSMYSGRSKPSHRASEQELSRTEGSINKPPGLSRVDV